jgi:hypothetical protein
MFLGLLTLLTSLTISSVAVYYSVSGLAAIFAGAYYPIIIMGAALEVGKLVTASWLHKNWTTAPKVLKAYLIISVVVLMLITSLGIFGFLSRAHIEQGAPVGDVSAQIELFDEKISAKRNEIEQARTALKNLDDVVGQFLAKGKDERSVAAANNARKNQQTERNKTSKVIDDAQKEISKLQEQKLPLTKQVRQIESEVGPIKYIAAFMYGDKPNQNLLEKAVTWMILTIIFVFDPLAVLLLIASQISFAHRKTVTEPIIKEVEKIVEVPVDRIIVEYKTIEVEKIVEVPVEKEVIKTITIERPVEVIVEKIVEKIVEVERPAIPTIITTVLDPTPTISTTTVFVNSEEPETVEYVQNSEQSANTLWQRIQKNKNIFKPMDMLYNEYKIHGFKDIDLNNQNLDDPEIQTLIKYVEDVKNGSKRFEDIPRQHLEKLADLITQNN